MAYIYKITNDKNSKVYVGKTHLPIKERFKQHYKEAKKDKCKNRPLYSAIRKYGIEHFSIELVEETCNPIEREKYWIGFYDGYAKGYNATLGGEGAEKYNHEEILDALIVNPRPAQVAKNFNCCPDTVQKIAKNNNIEVINSGLEDILKTKRKVYQYDKNNTFIQEFESTCDAALWCYQNGKCKSKGISGNSHISAVARGERKSAYGYVWKYLKE